MQELLGIGDAVIAEVRRLVPFGSPNQRDQANDSNTLRTTLSRRFINRMRVERGQRNLCPNSIRSWAFGGVSNQAGACGEMAALAYTILRGWPDSFEVCYVGVRIEANHTFVTIGSPTTMPADQVVVVDPWPMQPQALLLEDHFCRDEPFSIMRTGNAGKIGNYYRMMEKYQNGWRAAVLASCASEGLPNPMATFAMANRQTGTRRGQAIEYQGR